MPPRLLREKSVPQSRCPWPQRKTLPKSSCPPSAAYSRWMKRSSHMSVRPAAPQRSPVRRDCRGDSACRGRRMVFLCNRRTVGSRDHRACSRRRRVRIKFSSACHIACHFAAASQIFHDRASTNSSSNEAPRFERSRRARLSSESPQNRATCSVIRDNTRGSPARRFPQQPPSAFRGLRRNPKSRSPLLAKSTWPVPR